MSKYIRTKDAIYEVDENDIDEKIRIFSLYSYEIYSDLKFNALILDQADTIEELCDTFYWDWEDRFSIHNFMNYSVAKDTWDEYVNDCLEDNEKPDRNMYGCIKTDKGLIYVAKMNEKGDSELLWKKN